MPAASVTGAGNLPEKLRIERHKSRGLSKRPDDAWLFYVMVDIEGRFAGTQIKIGQSHDFSGMVLRHKEHQKRGGGTVRMRLLGCCWVTKDTDENTLKKRWHRARTKTFLEKEEKAKTNQPPTKEPYRPRTSNGEWLLTFLDPEIKQWLQWWIKQPYVANEFDETLVNSLKFAHPDLWLPPAHAPSISESLFDDESCHHNSLLLDKDPLEDKTGSFYTPDWIADLAREVMGSIDLDPASCKLANYGNKYGDSNPLNQKGIRAKMFFAHDGTKISWKGYKTIWINPPFGQWDAWWVKVRDELKADPHKQIMVLIPGSGICNAAINAFLRASDAIFIPPRRIEFWGPNADKAHEGHAILYFGTRLEQFRRVFEPYGSVHRKF